MVKWNVVVVCVVIWVLGIVSGAAEDRTDVEAIRRDQQRREQERLRGENAPDVRLQPEESKAEPFDLPVESPCFQIQTIELEDAADKFPWARRFILPYAGRCIGREGINAIAKRLTAEMIDRGYATTRVGVPEQDISTGTLKLAVIPGTIRSIKFADETLYGTWKVAFPADPGDILNIRDLEQGLEQMKRVPFQDVDIKILPGDLPGESDVVLAVQRKKPWRLGLSVDDSGSEATGKLQGTATLSIDNPFGISDLFYISGNHDLSNRDSQKQTRGGSVYYSFPLGYWTLTFFGSYNEYLQTVAGLVESFQYSGTNRTIEGTLQRIVHRGRNSKTSVSGRIIKRNAKTFLNDTEIEVQRRDVTAAEISVSHNQYIGAVEIDGSLAHRQGVPWFDAQPDATDPGAPTTRYKIETADLNIMVPFQIAKVPMRYRNLVRGQYTQDRLQVSEQFSIGNRYTVRGFDGEQTLLAERGWIMQNELGIPIFRTGQECYVGIDHGEVYGPSAELLAETRLTGSVVGLRGHFKGFSYDLFAGWPLDKPKRMQTDQPAVGFMASYQF